MLLALSLTLLVFSILVTDSASASPAWDPFEEIADPLTIDQPQVGHSLMFSGVDRSGGNVDSGNFFRIDPPGATFQNGDFVLAEMDGPGAITRIWVTGKDKQNKGPRLFGRIKIFIDDRETPVVDLPIHDIFGKSDPFLPPLATPTSGGFICYVPMPFQSYCKVIVTDHDDQYAHRTNGYGTQIAHLYHHINWRKLPAGTIVEPFALPLSNQRKEQLKKAIKGLSHQPAEQFAKVVCKPGERTPLFRTSGQGRVTGIQLKAEKAENLWLLGFWDGQKAASVDAPLEYFFGGGPEQGESASVWFAHKDDWYSCRFPMPYKDGAELYLANRGEEPVELQYWVAGSDENPSPLRFHAAWVDTYMSKGDPDLMLDQREGQGHFVGTSLYLLHDWLEGNESFSSDSDEANWIGTGTEDYFSGGWYFNAGPYAHPFSGCASKGDYVMMYRVHLLDNVSYIRSYRASLQHGGHNEMAGRARGVVYSYRKSE